MSGSGKSMLWERDPRMSEKWLANGGGGPINVNICLADFRWGHHVALNLELLTRPSSYSYLSSPDKCPVNKFLAKSQSPEYVTSVDETLTR